LGNITRFQNELKETVYITFVPQFFMDIAALCRVQSSDSRSNFTKFSWHENFSEIRWKFHWKFHL